MVEVGGMARGKVRGFTVPEEAKTGEWRDFYVEVENIGDRGLLFAGIANDARNPGDIIVKVEGEEYQVPPGYMLYAYTEVDSGGVIRLSGELKFTEPSVHMLYGVGGHIEDDKLIVDDYIRKISRVYAETEIKLSVPRKVVAGESFEVSGKLVRVDTGDGIADAEIEIYVDDSLEVRTETDSNGEFETSLTIEETGKHEITAKFPGKDHYLASEKSKDVTVYSSWGEMIKSYAPYIAIGAAVLGGVAIASRKKSA